MRSDACIEEVMRFRTGGFARNTRDQLRPRLRFGLAGVVLGVLGVVGLAQAADAPKKHLLVLGEEKGYRHEAVSHAMATIERLGRESGLWDTTIRTDTEVLTKRSWSTTLKT